MMDFERDIRPISDFKRNTPAMLKQLKQTGEPMVLTSKGKPEAVVMSPAAYQELWAAQERLEVLAAIRQGLAEADAGMGVPLEESMRAFARKHGLKARP